jgi:hypothetical protein
MATGATRATLDLPPSCGHAGGLAKGQPGRLFVADTRMVYEVVLAPAESPAVGEVARSFVLEGEVSGSFAAGSADSLWLGTYAREPGAKLFKIPFERLRSPIRAEDATHVVRLATEVQGAAFDQSGRLWITRSTGTFGELLTLDPASGDIEGRHAMPAGVEDISFDESGGLWTLSEAGSKRWIGWSTFFPVIFRLDIAKLR